MQNLNNAHILTDEPDQPQAMTSHPAAPTELTVRRLSVDLSQGFSRHWNGGDAFMTAYANALSMSFPVGEQFFIDAVKAGAQQLADTPDNAELKQIAKSFIGQEATHRHLHALYNAHLDKQGLLNHWGPRADRRMKKGRDELFNKSDKGYLHELAITAAFEQPLMLDDQTVDLSVGLGLGAAWVTALAVRDLRGAVRVRQRHDVPQQRRRADDKIWRVRGGVGVGAQGQHRWPAEHRQALIGRANQLWHTDSSFQPLPIKYSMLSAVILPEKGGQTEWADMRAAYDALDEETRASLEGLRVYHTIVYSRHVLGFDFNDDEKEKLKGAIHPLVRTIPTSGRRALYLGNHAFGGHSRGGPGGGACRSDFGVARAGERHEAGTRRGPGHRNGEPGPS